MEKELRHLFKCEKCGHMQYDDKSEYYSICEKCGGTSRRVKKKEQLEYEKAQTQPPKPEPKPEPKSQYKDLQIEPIPKVIKAKEQEQEKAVCGHCGAEIIGKPKVCPNCGYILEWEDE